jgi:hypothetical protein
MTANGQPGYGHVDVFGYVDVDVAESDEYRHRGLFTVYLRFTQIEVDVA